MSAFIGFICFIGLVAGLVIIIKLDKQKKPIKPGVLIMVASFLISLIGIPFVPSVPTQASLSNTTAQSTEISKDDSEDKAKKEAEEKAKAEAEAKEKAEAEAKAKADAEAKAKEESVPREHKSALKKAESYAEVMHMSKAGIYDQLTSEYGESFPVEAAQYAIDNIEFDWKENALKKAQSYAKTMNMSDSAIYEQLISEHGEKFTPEEAQYAIDNLE
ncbi:Ltp family lipoprotein [Brevibacillus reuszeri]|uniref:Ltp family lipoprotein n=1 Tax=Brevibacillus reuszeri TaxID=54915 RepID=UPI00366BE63F